MEIGKYDIVLDIDFDGLKYTGKEKIEVYGNGEKFYLNSVGLNVRDVRSGGKSIPFRLNEKEQRLETDLTISGQTVVDVEFSADIKQILQGLYVAKYQGGQMLTTQFESTGARRAFPCIDHPSYKAVFSLKLAVGKDLEAISNMPVLKEEPLEEGKKLVTFQDTPKMSTYLLYMGIGHFEHMERQMGKIKGILTAPKGQLQTTDFALVEADNVIRYFEDYYGIDYVLPKLHLISVPEFGAGAMENWGAITFREVLLIVNENTSNTVKQTISEVVAHELAHQWFGDLVTMEWWNDLWLNESFATFMAYKAVDHLHPEWKMFGKLLLSDTGGALTGDALRNSHPIDADVKSPDDIAQIFDEISYGKGASILRMIEGYVGEKNFRDGIRKYLKDNMYGNAKGSDLWSSIEQVSGMPVSKVMEAWIKKEGYPVLELSRSGDRIKIRQERFMFKENKETPLWPVPLTILRKSGKESLLMDKEEIEIDSRDFIKLNVDESGFYRVLYNQEFMDNIRKSMDQISYLDSWGLVSDLFAFLRSGRIGLDHYLDGIAPFLGDEEYVVAQEIAGQLLTLNLLVLGNSKLRTTAVNFYRNHVERLGQKQPGEEENDSILRGTVSLNLSMVDHEYAKEIARGVSDFFRTDPDVRQAVALGYADSSNDFERLVKLLEDSTADEDRIRILGALSWLKGEENFNKLINLTESDKVKKQDMMRVYMALSMNPEQRRRMFQAIDTAVTNMEEYFEGTAYTGMLLESIIPFLGIGIEKEMEKKVTEIRKDSYSKGIDKGMELLSIYSGLVNRSS